MTGKEASPVPRPAQHELLTRVVSALGLALAALAATWFGGVVFALLWSAAASLFFAEFLAMIAYRPLFQGAALGAIGLVAAGLGLERGLWSGSLGALCLTGLAIGMRAETGTAETGGRARYLAPLGLLYSASVALPVILMRSEPRGLALTLWLFAIVWATDIGAFFVGRTLGGPKLWKRVSPNKTWSGLIGGTLFGATVALLVHNLLPAAELPVATLASIAVLTSLAAHAGDLLESALKRRFSIKDSSQLIPGHGGFMDRLDGFAVASFVLLLAILALR